MKNRKEEKGVMVELLQNSVLFGVIGSVGATTAILIYNTYKEKGVTVELLQSSALYGVIGSFGATLAILLYNITRTCII